MEAVERPAGFWGTLVGNALVVSLQYFGGGPSPRVDYFVITPYGRYHVRTLRRDAYESQLIAERLETDIAEHGIDTALRRMPRR